MSFIPKRHPNADATNGEGLTWEEWACAAGVAHHHPEDKLSGHAVFIWEAKFYTRAQRKGWSAGEDPGEWRK